MRTAIVSAACSLLFLLYSDAAFAQSSPALSPPPQTSLSNLPWLAKPSELWKSSADSGLQAHNDLETKGTNLRQPRMNLFYLQQGASPGPDLRTELGEWVGKGQCAHIIIFQAPESDSEMVMNVPPDTGGPITTFKGLGPCCRDIRPSTALPKFPGLKVFPRRPPLLQRPFVPPPSAQPKDNNAPGPNSGNSLNHLRP